MAERRGARWPFPNYTRFVSRIGARDKWKLLGAQEVPTPLPPPTSSLVGISKEENFSHHRYTKE